MKTYDYELELSLMRLREKRNRRKILIGICLWCICIWGLVYWMYGISVVSGSSMRPAFCSGDVLIYERGVPKKLEYGDVLIIKSWLDQDKDYVKRIVGLPGDVMEVDEKGYVIRNGEQVKESEVLHGFLQADSDISFPYRVPADEYFCLGDNRPVSLDSRVFGSLKKKQILGKVIGVLRFGV